MDIITTPHDLSLVVSQPLDQNPAAVYLAGLTEKSRRVQGDALRTIAGLVSGQADALAVNWSKLRFQHTAAVRSILEERYPVATANRMLSALRGVLKAAWKLEQMTAEDYYRAKSIENIKGSTVPAGRALADGEIAALMGACESDTTPAGPRDAAIIGIMAGSGLRRDEVIKLDLTDYNPESEALKVNGKGKKQRMVYLENGTRGAMLDWLELRGKAPGALFVPVDKAGRLEFRRMTDQAIYFLLQKRGTEAGVSDLSPHDLRRTCITKLLEAGVDALTVSKIAGHSSTNTTLRYDRRPETAKQQAIGKLHIPYHRRMV